MRTFLWLTQKIHAVQSCINQTYNHQSPQCRSSVSFGLMGRMFVQMLQMFIHRFNRWDQKHLYLKLYQQSSISYHQRLMVTFFQWNTLICKENLRNPSHSLSREETVWPPAECHDSLFQMKHDCKHRRVCLREVPMCKLLTSFTSETRSSQSHLLRPSKHKHTHTDEGHRGKGPLYCFYYRYDISRCMKTQSNWARETNKRKEWDCVLGLFNSTHTVQLVQHGRNILPIKTLGNYY